MPASSDRSRTARRAVLLVALLAVPIVAGCLGDIRQQNTRILLFLKASEEGVLDHFMRLEVLVVNVVLRPREQAVEPVAANIFRSVDLVAASQGGPERILDAKIPYRDYGRVSLRINVTEANLQDGRPQVVMIPEDSIYYIEKPFKTRLAGDVAYHFAIGVSRAPNGDYFLQSRAEESGARSV